MSFQAMTWAVAQDCANAGQKLVLLMLANYCNGHTGQCNPSHKRLAAECCMGVSTLKNHLLALAEAGKIEIVKKYADGVQLPNQYMLKLGGVGQNLADPRSEYGYPPGQNLATNQELKPVIEPIGAPQSVANKRGTRLPQDWALPMKWGEWTLSEFPSWNPQTVRAEADKFRDFWHAKAGKDACKLDWEATWRNWCRNAKPSIQGQPQRETPYAQHMRERVEQAAGSLAHIVAAKAPGQYQRIREPWEVAADEQRTIENGQTGTPAISMD